MKTFDPKIVPFKRKAGVELSWHSPQLPKGRRNMQSDIDTYFAEILNSYHAKRGENVYREVYCDPGCIEIPSPLLYSWKDLDKFWNFWEPICEDFRLQRFPEDHTGGAGHIHIDCTEWEQIKVCRDIASRPYLSWAFLHPSDDINARTIATLMINTSRDAAHPLPQWMAPGLTAESWKKRPHIQITNSWGNMHRYREHAQHDKYCVVNMTGTEGLEFRALTGALDLEEQRHHMAFVQAYIEYCIKQPTANVPWANRNEAVSFLDQWKDYDKCETEFLDLILTLGLDPNTYLEYPQTWMKPRFTQKGMGRLI